MGRVVLNRDKSQQKPAPRPTNWYEDAQALARVYPNNIIPENLPPNYDPKNEQYLIEVNALCKRLEELKIKMNIPDSPKKGVYAEYIENFYRNILKRINPDHPQVINMNGTKFEELDNKGLIWVKKYLEVILDHIALHEDMARLESVVNSLGSCGGGVVDDLRRQANLCRQPDGLLEVGAQARIATIDELTSRQIKERNGRSLKDRNGKPIITKMQEGFEKHIPIAFLQIADLYNINVPLSAMESEKDKFTFDTHPLKIRHDKENKLSFYWENEQQATRATAMAFDGYDLDKFPDEFFDIYGEIFLNQLANRIEEVVREIFEQGMKNKAEGIPTEDLAKTILDILVAKYKIKPEDLSQSLFFEVNPDTNEIQLKSPQDLTYWCQVLAAHVLVKENIAQPYEKEVIWINADGGELSAVKVNDLNYYTYAGEFISPSDLIKLAFSNGFGEKLMEKVKGLGLKPTDFFFELLVLVEELRDSETQRSSQESSAQNSTAQQIRQLKNRLDNPDDENEDDIQELRNRLQELEAPRPQPKKPIVINYQIDVHLEQMLRDCTEDQARRLLECHLTPNQVMSILMGAYRRGWNNIVDLCLERNDLNLEIPSPDGQTILYMAVKKHDIDLTIKLIKLGAKAAPGLESALLGESLQIGHLANARKLLKAGVKPDFNYRGYNLLYLAAQFDNFEDSLEIQRLLITHGVTLEMIITTNDRARVFRLFGYALHYQKPTIIAIYKEQYGRWAEIYELLSKKQFDQIDEKELKDNIHKEIEKETYLSYAWSMRDPQIISFLLKHIESKDIGKVLDQLNNEFPDDKRTINLMDIAEFFQHEDDEDQRPWAEIFVILLKQKLTDNFDTITPSDKETLIQFIFKNTMIINMIKNQNDPTLIQQLNKLASIDPTHFKPEILQAIVANNIVPEFDLILALPYFDLIMQKTGFSNMCTLLNIEENSLDALKLYARAELHRFEKKREPANYTEKITALKNAKTGQEIIDALNLHNKGSYSWFLTESNSLKNLPEPLKPMVVHEGKLYKWVGQEQSENPRLSDLNRV